jgi:plastocyanin
MHIRAIQTLLLLACLLALGAQRGGATRSVSIAGGRFVPANISASVGDTVQWSNADDKDHWIEADQGAFASGKIKPGGSFGVRFVRAGTYAYHCKLHPREKGIITVR